MSKLYNKKADLLNNPKFRKKYKIKDKGLENNPEDLPRGLQIDTTTGEGANITRIEKAKGGRIEYSKGTMPARNKKNFRSTKSGAGMTEAGVKAYRRLNPGSKLKTAVTGKVKPGSKAAKRRKSYCARSLGQLKRASAKTRNDPNSRIRQARRRWKC